jgi:hypothetical protein
MKRLSLATLGTIGLFILACAGGEEEGGGAAAGGEEAGYEYEEGGDLTQADLPAVQLTEPWLGMNLPLADGTVVLSDKTVMLVGYEGGSIAGLSSSYADAIQKAGWAKAEDYSTPDFTAIVFTKGAQKVGFAVGTEEGITFVYAEDMDGVSEEESAVKQAKSGKKAGGKFGATSREGRSKVVRKSYGGGGGGAAGGGGGGGKAKGKGKGGKAKGGKAKGKGGKND